MLDIKTGKQKRPQKVIIYGPEGIGKTTIASMFPSPLFIDTEGGTSHIDVSRIDKPKSFSDLLAIVKEVAITPNVCKTLVIDTMDWAETLCAEELLKSNSKQSIEAFGYGKGYTMLAEKFAELLNALDLCISGGINVVATAHAKMRKFEQPDEMGAYDRWEMKLSKQVAPIVKEWADMVLFCNYKTIVVTGENGTKKAQGGKRVMYCTHNPCWDAKNRHGLPDELQMSYEPIKHIFEENTSDQNTEKAKPVKTSAKKQEPVNEVLSVYDTIKELMKKDDIIEVEVQQVVAAKGHFPMSTPISKYPEEFIREWLIPYWENIKNMILDDPNRLPF